MTRTRIATALALLGAAFILYIGISYLVTPESIAAGFGLPAQPTGDAVGFLDIKGVRDTVCGVLILALLATRQRFALGVALSALALIPLGDMLTVLRWDGSTATALGVHGFTAVLVAATGALLLTEGRRTHTAAVTA
ncbi:MAG TPA: DUF4267 domain-containing protein [Nocardia sp.]|uniref:DUF4267 domain-containing protein n=1 Tax=Nocardia sp. TaxID=1821 RepID=UPI002B4AE644|nr:DUF4267 domain-containing protein [Nocardia sp.]HLS76667.1 DUF4267 domain-containing protein [Nocardia sp.]